MGMGTEADDIMLLYLSDAANSIVAKTPGRQHGRLMMGVRALPATPADALLGRSRIDCPSLRMPPAPTLPPVRLEAH
jgi:hypothetical protein